MSMVNIGIGKNHILLAGIVLILLTSGVVMARSFDAPGEPNPPIYTTDGVGVSVGNQTINTGLGIVAAPGEDFAFRVNGNSLVRDIRTVSGQASESFVVAADSPINGTESYALVVSSNFTPLSFDFSYLGNDYSDTNLLTSRNSLSVDSPEPSIKGGINFDNPTLSLDAESFNDRNEPDEFLFMEEFVGHPDIAMNQKHPVCATQNGTLVRCPAQGQIFVDLAVSPFPALIPYDGGTATLTWTSSGVSNCSASASPSSDVWNGIVADSNNQGVDIAFGQNDALAQYTVTYAIICEDADGNILSDSVNVTHKYQSDSLGLGASCNPYRCHLGNWVQSGGLLTSEIVNQCTGMPPFVCGIEPVYTFGEGDVVCTTNNPPVQPCSSIGSDSGGYQFWIN